MFPVHKRLIILSIWALLLPVFSASLGVTQAAFSDVSEKHPYALDVQFLESRGVVSGSTFEPEAFITRQELAKWLLKNAGFIDESYEMKTRKFITDVMPKENEFAPYIYRLVDIGVLEKEKGREKLMFEPRKKLTKKEALEWVFLVEGVSVPLIFDENTFKATDVRPSSPNAPLIHRAVELGLLSPGKTKPNSYLKRGEAAHFLRAIKSSANNVTITLVPSSTSSLVSNPKYDVLLTAWDQILNNYLRRDQVNQDALVYAAVEGMVKELKDKYSGFERPEDNALLETLSGQIEGIGAVIQLKDEEVIIVTPLDGSPAEKAGLMPNDKIVEINGTKVSGLKLSEIVAKIKGKKGTEVTLGIERKGKKLSFTIMRDIVKIISVNYAKTPDLIGIVTLNEFSVRSDSEFREAVSKIEQSPPKGLILDLRNNPGGFLTKSIDIAGYFIEKGKAVVSVKYPQKTETLNSSGSASLAKFPLIVLVNKGSASASEILAGALKDHGIGKIIGETTFGKGTVQELSDFSDGSTLKLTVAEWLTPSGHSIEGNGVSPDIEIILTDEDYEAKRDPQMERALLELRK